MTLPVPTELQDPIDAERFSSLSAQAPLEQQAAEPVDSTRFHKLFYDPAENLQLPTTAEVVAFGQADPEKALIASPQVAALPDLSPLGWTSGITYFPESKGIYATTTKPLITRILGIRARSVQ